MIPQKGAILFLSASNLCNTLDSSEQNHYTLYTKPENTLTKKYAKPKSEKPLLSMNAECMAQKLELTLKTGPASMVEG